MKEITLRDGTIVPESAYRCWCAKPIRRSRFVKGSIWRHVDGSKHVDSKPSIYIDLQQCKTAMEVLQ